MQRYKLWAGIGLVVAIALAGLWAWWRLDLRWRPTVLKKNADQVARLLEGAGWVSSGGSAPPVYVVAHRNSPQSVRFYEDVVGDLRRSGRDVRLILIAQADLDGAPRSTPGERATVAELWVNRSWNLAERWFAAPADTWRTEGIPAAEGDAGRTAVVEAGRRFADDLAAALKTEGLGRGDLTYPTVIWRAPDGALKACACDRREKDRYLRADLAIKAGG